MTESSAYDPVADAWSAHRRRVRDVCYRMLGTVSDAEDAVSETFARLAGHGTDGIDDVEGWLITVASRVCLDHLRADRTRARYVGPWLPEPIVGTLASGPDPADRITLDDSVRIALLEVLEQLSPAERVVFVLHDVFGRTFTDIAAIVGRSPAACRKLASRARATIRAEGEPRFDVDHTAAREVAARFAAACQTGDLDALLAVLDPAVVGEFDSGGAIQGAPLEPISGAERVAGTLRDAFAGSGAVFDTADVNSQPGVTASVDGHLVAVISLDTDGTRVRAIRAIGNPAKLAHLIA